MSKDNTLQVRVDDPTMRKVLQIASYLEQHDLTGEQITTSKVVRYAINIAAINIEQERKQAAEL